MSKEAALDIVQERVGSPPLPLRSMRDDQAGLIGEYQRESSYWEEIYIENFGKF